MLPSRPLNDISGHWAEPISKCEVAEKYGIKLEEHQSKVSGEWKRTDIG